MRMLRIGLLLLASLIAFSPAVTAGETDPLFVNLTTDNGHRAKMAVAFAKNQLERKHPVTIFLNDRGVMLGSKVTARKFKEHQEILAAMMKQGATVLICPMCMKHYGVEEQHVVEGIKVGNPELVGGALFKDNGKTLTW